MDVSFHCKNDYNAVIYVVDTRANGRSVHAS